MSYWSPEKQEEVIVISTNRSTPRWLQITAKILVGLLVLLLLGAGIVAWRYHTVQQRLKKDLTSIIQEEEHLRSLGGVNAVADIIAPDAPNSWRFRYLSSVQAREGRSEPQIQVAKVNFDGRDARVALLVDDELQYRHYHLYGGKYWRRAPFVANGWGKRRVITAENGTEIIYWDEDEASAQEISAKLPQLEQWMSSRGVMLQPGKLMFIPQEFGDLVHPAALVDGWNINSVHVDWIEEPQPGLTRQQILQVELGRSLVAQARSKTPPPSQLAGAIRGQRAIDEVLLWQWTAGQVPETEIMAWTKMLKGHWVSPRHGLPPELIAQLPTNAPDIAARLLMTWVLQNYDLDTLLALDAALNDANSWDEAYQQVLGLSAAQVEDNVQQWLQLRK